MDWHPIVYGILTIVLAIIGIILLGFLPGADVQAGELFGDFVDDFFSIFRGDDDESNLVDHFNNVFINEYDSCVDNDAKGCWCMKDEFKIPKDYFMEVVQSNQKTQFRILDRNQGNIDHADFIMESCVIAGQKRFLLDDLKDNKILLESGKVSFVSFELDSLDNILETDYKNEIDIGLMFYKMDDGKICILDKVNSESFENKPMCNQNT